MHIYQSISQKCTFQAFCLPARCLETTRSQFVFCSALSTCFQFQCVISVIALEDFMIFISACGLTSKYLRISKDSIVPTKKWRAIGLMTWTQMNEYLLVHSGACQFRSLATMKWLNWLHIYLFVHILFNFICLICKSPNLAASLSIMFSHLGDIICPYCAIFSETWTFYNKSEKPLPHPAVYYVQDRLVNLDEIKAFPSVSSISAKINWMKYIS